MWLLENNENSLGSTIFHRKERECVLYDVTPNSVVISKIDFDAVSEVETVIGAHST